MDHPLISKRGMKQKLAKHRDSMRHVEPKLTDEQLDIINQSVIVATLSIILVEQIKTSTNRGVRKEDAQKWQRAVAYLAALLKNGERNNA